MDSFTAWTEAHGFLSLVLAGGIPGLCQYILKRKAIK